MASAQQIPLFDRGPRRPTTRDIADRVRAGGPGGLPSPTRRADAVTYQEVTCRSALNAVRGMPFEWTLNPYRGCTHGCHYCFARRYQTQFELDAGDSFSTIVLVKANFVEVLARELASPRWSRAPVALGTATDPYQPIEGHYRLTRGTLVALSSSRTPVGVVTKGPMVLRDSDVLAPMSARGRATVYVSVPTTDEAIWRELEPGTAPPAQRLRAARQLIDAGVRAAVLMAPLVPGFSTRRSALAPTLRAIVDLDLPLAGTSLLHLEGGTRDHFLSYLAGARPDLLERYRRLYAARHAPPPYRDAVHDVVEGLCRQYGVKRLRRDPV